MQDYYSDDRRVWNALFELMASEFEKMEKEGVDLGSEGICYPIVLGCKGDWSFLVP